MTDFCTSQGQPFFTLGMDELPHRPLLDSYTKTKFGSKERSFQKSWFKQYEWLKYLQDGDYCLCYPCRKFGMPSAKEKAFTETGFRNWKVAVERGRGLKKHDELSVHMAAVALWNEKKN